MNQFDQHVLSAIGKSLLKRGETIAISESVTSGLLQWAIGSITDAMRFYQGGITVYNIAQKFHHLGVEPISAEDCNAVSAKVAGEMALGVCRLFGSQWGIGITGFASPVPESGNKLFAYYAIAYRQEIRSAKIVRPRTHDTAETQWTYVSAILADLRKQAGSRKK